MAKAKVEQKKSSMDFLSNLPDNERPVLDIDIDLIDPDPNQPRQTWHSDDGIVPDAEKIALENLASDIQAQDVLQPITLRETDNGRYMIVIGERRWRASKLAGKPTVPAIVRQDLSGAKVRLAQLAENVHRQDMSDLDTALFVKKMLDEDPELQKRDLAQFLNKHPSYISRMMAFVDPRWAHVVTENIITHASVLEQFRALSEETQSRLIENAKTTGASISAQEVQEAKRADKAENKVPARGALDDFGKEFADVIESQQDVQETYSRKPDAVIDSGKQIKDVGSETINVSNSPSDIKVPDHLLDSQEVRMTIGQLAKLIETVSVDASVTVTLPLSSDVMTEAINLLGGEVPDNQTWLGKALLDSLK